MQDPEVPVRPPKFLGTNESASNNRVEQQKRLSPPIHPTLPSSLRRRYDAGEEGPPLEHHPHSVNPSDEGVRPSEMQERSSHVDNKVNGVCNSSVVRDCQFWSRIVH